MTVVHRTLRANTLRGALLAVVSIALCDLAAAQVSVTTQHNDNSRTGQNLSETLLTPANVNPTSFGKLFAYPVDGMIYAQPLYLSNISINGGAHNVVFVATEHDSVYAFDADNQSGSGAGLLWQVSLLSPDHGAAAGATTVPWSAGADIEPEAGITGTPVIDPATQTLYVVSDSKEGTSQVLRLHALDVRTGAEKFAGPVTINASVPGTGAGSANGTLSFNPVWENQRPGLLLLNGIVYVGFSSHEDAGPWHGWILGYDGGSLRQTGAFCVTPNGVGGGIWMSGAGLAADRPDPVGHPYGRMFVPTGNGDYGVAQKNYSDSHLNLDLTGGVLTVADEFTTGIQAYLTNNDLDADSGGLLILPAQTAGTHPNLLVQAGKVGTIYLLDRDNLGGYNTTSDQAVQELQDAVGSRGVWSSPAYWNGTVYYWGQFDHLKAFSMINGLLSAKPVESSESQGFPGATPSISANGNSQGIVWSIDSSGSVNGAAAILRAHDATNVATTLYSSTVNPLRDKAGAAVKFAVPTIANGKVYVGTARELDVYGFLAAAAPTFSPAGGTFNPSVTVTISDPIPGASIYYTTDGSTPNSSSSRYTGPIAINTSATLKAIALVAGYPPSSIASSTYSIGTVPPVVNYSAGFASSAGLSLLGGSVKNGALQLTDGGHSEAHAAWYATPVNVQSFNTDFTFQESAAAGDGFTFTIQNAGLKALGSYGGGLGYAGIGSSVAVKFDLFNNGGEGSDSTGFYTNGAQPTVPAIDMTSSGVNLHGTDIMAVHLAYDGTTLTMTIVDTATSASFTTSKVINIPATVRGNTAYVGFTAGSGGLTAVQGILNWTYFAGAGGSGTSATATPTFSPPAGSYTTAQLVSLTDATAAATIYYTTDGSTPTTTASLYSAPIAVTSSETLKALAIAPGSTASAVVSASYSIGGTAQIINYSSGFSSAAGLTLHGSAAVANGGLVLTNTGRNEASAAWYATPVNIQSFTTDFTFQEGAAVADGFTFTVQNAGAAALGSYGGGLGYAGIGWSVAVKFDLFGNAGEGSDSTGFYTNGAQPTMPAIDLTASGVNLHSADIMAVHVVYDGTTLTMKITDTATAASFTASKVINIPATLRANTGYVGFTAGSGALTATQTILSWTLETP